MPEPIKKIHFINRIDRDNAGDWNCCPLEYYYNFFKSYNIIRHDLDFVDFNEINQNDIVILGGGGIFFVSESFNRNINKILSLCENVIVWSGGFNTHSDRWPGGIVKKFSPIDFNRFKIITIRDYMHPSGIEYLPCPSCLALTKDNRIMLKRKFGIITHKCFNGLNFSGFEQISNSCGIEKINEFILSSEAIITNSYHCAYWGILLKKKVIVINKWSTKFDFYKYKPEFVEIEDNESETTIKEKIYNAFEIAQVYPSALEEAVRANNEFFKRVEKYVLECKFETNNNYQLYYQINQMKSWRLETAISKIESIDSDLLLLKEEITKLRNALIIKIIKEKTIGKKVAIKGGGLHTQKLLELLEDKITINCIIARSKIYDFGIIPVISDVEIDNYSDIDLIILSSYKWRESMIEDINHYEHKYEILDLYDEMKQLGYEMTKEFYCLY